MHKECVIEKIPIKYSIRRNRRARRANLTLKSDGALVVTLPLAVREAYAERLIRSKARWVLRHLKELDSGKYVRLPGGRANFEARREMAHALASERVRHFSKLLGIAVWGVRIKNHKTQWGSCSESGFLNFNYRIVFLPSELVDYVVIHELCHRVHMNHSRAFWMLAERVLPGCRRRERGLKRYRF